MRQRDSIRIRTLAILLFGATFGYVEGAIVVYLRTIYTPLRETIYPQSDPGALFPLIRLEDLQAAGPEHLLLLKTELVREAATLVMLASVAAAVARNRRQWLAAFGVVFGIWDIVFYLTLKVVLGWPDSLLTWDLLFLLPVPWTGPVLAPVLVSISMIAAGYALLWREWHGLPVRLTLLHWAGLVGGGLIVVLSFTLDFRSAMAGALPERFPWWLLAIGESVGIATFLHATKRHSHSTVSSSTAAPSP